MTAGWYRMQRGWRDSRFFKLEPYTEREAWEWLISHAAWKAHSVNVNSMIVNLERGQLVASLRTLASRWRWTEKRVRGLLTRMANEKMIERNTENWAKHGAKITICNYEQYQTDGHSEGQTEGTVRAQSGHTREERKEGKEPSPPRKNVYPAGFETFWQAYPKRTTDSKRMTAKAYERALGEASHEVLLAAAKNYQKHLAQKGKMEFSKGAAAWLNAAMWEGFTGEVVSMRDAVDGQPRRFSPCPL